ncbi:MAG: ABC transporter permease [Candidatus Anammoximicrobium sp.]|nr:ABC transporter permease [Candidatus Anammoximicrobium sp.]
MDSRTLAWWTIFRIGLEERLVYRGDFALATLMRFLPIITQIFLWWAVFDSVGGVQSQAKIVGYRFENVVAYYLLTMVSRAFSSVPGLASGIARQIRSGEIKKFLIQPVDMIGFLMLSRIAHKTAYYTVATIPFAIVFYLCRGYFVDGWPEPSTLAAFGLSLILGFLLGFFLETTIGLIGFWFLEISSLLFVYMLLSYFLSGHMFPLDMLPAPWNLLVDVMPLKYLAYFPSAVFLGKVTGPDLVRELSICAAWVVFFVILSRVMYHRGVKRYSGYGG